MAAENNKSLQGIALYNSLTRKKEAFVPLAKGTVSMYVCGITAYDEPHIGHARSAFIFDVIARVFRSQGFTVRYVRNITDIDDKIIKRAREAQEKKDARFAGQDLKETCRRIADFYIEVYRRQLDALGLEKPTWEPKATECIADMQGIIARLIKNGFAYTLDSGVYFDIASFKKYGVLSHRNPEEMLEFSEPFCEGKKSDLDFALWKRAKPDEPSWESPWGEGRPGWHIECSAMSSKYLGIPFDIHGGGLDLIFPHHENELVQSYAYAGKNPVTYWIHNGLLTIEGKKMSKSLGNFVTIEELLRKTNPEALKLSFLSTHYAHPFNFSFDKLAQAQTAFAKITGVIEKIEQLPSPRGTAGDTQELSRRLETFQERFFFSLRDDFNTPSAVAVLFDMASFAQNVLSEAAAEKAYFLKEIFVPALIRLSALLGLTVHTKDTARTRALYATLSRALEKASQRDPLLARALEPLKDASCREDPYKMIHHVIDARNAARAQKDFTLADGLRVFLQVACVALEDSRGATFFRIEHHGQ